jgi:hypothetical protein
LARQAASENLTAVLALGGLCALFVVAGFILGLVALVSGKGDGRGQALAGVCINGILILLAVFNILAYQKALARENDAPARPARRPWSYISGK